MGQLKYNLTVDSLRADDKNNAKSNFQKCSKCHEQKSPEAFYYRSGKADRICKECKKSAQKDHYRKKTFAQNADEIFGNILNKILEYKIDRARLVLDELRRLEKECEAKL